VGELCRHAAGAHAGSRHFDSVADLVAALPQAPAARAVVVKGSRFMKMEQVVAALLSPATSSEIQGKPNAA
jgi:UDP-N-acetylmuramoyl-tripeptide--D-alanyl-D-alanine ligase